MEENENNSIKFPVTEITNQCDSVPETVEKMDDSKINEDEGLIGVNTAEDFGVSVDEGSSLGKEEAAATTVEEEREASSPIGGTEIEVEGGGVEAASKEVKDSEIEVAETEEIERKVESSGEVEVNVVGKDVIETEREDEKKGELEVKDVSEAGRDYKEDELESKAVCVDAEAETKDEIEIKDACEAEGEVRADLEKQKESESKVVPESISKDDLGTESVVMAECKEDMEEQKESESKVVPESISKDDLGTESVIMAECKEDMEEQKESESKFVSEVVFDSKVKDDLGTKSVLVAECETTIEESCEVDCKTELAAEVLDEASNVVEANGGESGTGTKLISDKEEVEEKQELGVVVRQSQSEVEEIADKVNLEHSTDIRSVAEDAAMVDTNLAMEIESKEKNDDMEVVPDFCDEEDDMETEREAEENAEGAAFDSQLDESQLAEDEEDDRMVGDEAIPAADIEMETETDAGDSVKISGEKRKRGRNPKTTAKAHLRNMGLPVEEEDVCFVCFDGGDLVLCDRKNCPKAYHPSCVNRDEKFFQAKGRWNCGWHQCSHTNCQKNAYYMCYTCTFSLCKGCIKDDVILCVRGNKGFCEACMKIVTMIEDTQQGNQVQIDFDDKSSWEYLFKDYWIDLKDKLSISSDEIAQAKNPWKGSEVVAGSAGEQLDMKDDGGFGSDNASDNPEASKPKTRKGKKRLKSRAKQDELTSEAAAAGAVGTSTPKSTEWASKELLEFVIHMKDGDTTMLSQFDVQALLLEYIKRNKLRDPRRKSQIICDVRLQNIFGKARVGHFEMLKLLESHFLTREDTQVDDVQGSVVDTETNHLDAEGNTESLTKSGKDRKRKTRKKNGRGRQSNLDDYAAIDVHNISLIYLRRKLMEDLLEDIETFSDKVVGTFVRIRISGSNPKQDIYRLVQVIGTSKVDELYKVGKRTTNLMLEILNLNKTEVISIDSISNQDFTEEECKRLRQSIKLGLINRLSVGEILDKAMEVQVARVNDWLEVEVLRLTHLRDRASDLGKKKQLRECVESLQLLKTPEERRRRLEDIPQIHADPKMDPAFESEDNDSEIDSNKQELYTRSRTSSFSRRGREPISPGSGDVKDSWGANMKASGESWESNRNLSNKNLANKVEDASNSITTSVGNSWNYGRGSEVEPYKLEKPTSSSSPGAFGLIIHSATRSDSFSQVQSQKSPGPLTAPVTTAAVNINETEKMWYYEDPHGKVQGPFSMVQLRKWSNTGYFPADLRIWRNSGNKDDSLLLTDALAGKFQKGLQPTENGNPKGNSMQSPHLPSTHTGKLHESSSLKGREVLDAEVLNPGQNHVTMDSHINPASRKWDAPSGDVPVLSADRTNPNYSNRINSVNLPSPTPRHSSAGEVGSFTASVSLPGSIEALQSPAAAIPDSARNSTLGSHSGFGVSPRPEQGILVGSTDSLQTSQSPATVLSHGGQSQGHQFTASESNANVVQSVTSQNPALGTHGWNSATTQSMEANSSSQVSVQQPTFAQWGGVPSTPVQNPATNFPMQGVSSMQPANPWRPPAPNNQSNVQWSIGVAENSMPAQNVQPDNSIPGWGSMQVIPNMGWAGPNPNMNWMASVQGPQPGNINPGWAMQAGNPGATFQGAVPGNLNPGWVATPQMLAPMNANQGWFPTGNMAQNAQGPVPGNGNIGMTATTGNLGPNVQQNQMSGNANSGWSAQPSGNANQGWAPPAGNQGNQRSENHRDGDRFSSQNDQGSHRGRSWNKQSSFGGSGSRNGSRGICYQFQETGHCRRGSSCSFRHTS